MPENTFQCVDNTQNLESCKHCQCREFEMRETLATAIVCAKCKKFHKNISERAATQKEMLDEMFDFARRHGE